MDIYNEGVDILEVSTVLFLRPMESLTVFLQRLGRGLRLAEDKEFLTVLDFIGRYNFEEKFAALLSNTSAAWRGKFARDSYQRQRAAAFSWKSWRRGTCDSIRASYGSAAGLVTRVAKFTDNSGLELTLAKFLKKKINWQWGKRVQKLQGEWKMTELEKINYAKSYVEQLANGVNPLTGAPIPDGDLLNNVRISRCLFYVNDILRQVVEKDGVTKPEKKSKKEPFSLEYEERRKFEYSDTPISIGELVKRINALIDTEKMSKMHFRCISDWLLELGFLCSDVDAQGKRFRKPTAKGTDFGLTTVRRRGENGDYIQTLYNRSAQQFILDNLDAALELYNKRQD